MSEKESFYEKTVPVLLTVFSVVALLAAIWRMFIAEDAKLARFDTTTLVFLGVAGALLLMRDVKTLAFGDYKIEFARLEKIAQDAKTKAETSQATAEDAKTKAANSETKAEDAQAKAADAQVKAENAGVMAVGTGGNPKTGGAAAEAFERGATEAVAADQWKGKFGGSPFANDRQLTADVKEIPGSRDLFSVVLKVFSTRPEKSPLTGSVRFFLHQTFSNDRPIIPVGADGVAELKLTAWGAFTVGATTDDGATRLELDLAELPDAPTEFTLR